jgi:hypothetical protein
MPLVVSDGFAVRPQLILTQVDVVIPGDAIPPGIDVYRSEKRRDAEQAKLGAREQHSAVVGLLLAVPKTDEQTCWPERPDRVDSG